MGNHMQQKVPGWTDFTVHDKHLKPFGHQKTHAFESF